MGREDDMRLSVVTLILAVFWSVLPAHAATPCLHFEPAVESIVGTLVRKTFPGPPNYEDIKKGDQAETGWYVNLMAPVCLTGTPGDDLNSEDVAGVKLIQLVLTHDEYKTHTRLVGKKVKATGTFFTGHTGHHHTDVLISVDRIAGAMDLLYRDSSPVTSESSP